MEICSVNNCTGCFACMNICPKNAISVITDDLGKTIPHIDEKKCINCGLCNRTCPVNNDIDLKKADKAYAVWSKDKKDVQISSSGGAAAVFASTIINNGGVVYGCGVIDGKAKHICVDTLSDFDMLRGSKYVQGEIGLIYRDVKDKLNSGIDVLFIGTPCQVSGLLSYLVKKYDNLVTIDLICHGTPPHKYLEEYIDVVAKGSKYTSYSFRGKYDGYLSIYNGTNSIYQKNKLFDIYYLAFYNKLTFRDNCYNCKYARPERVSDITIGDFWGIDRNSMTNKYGGRISVVLPNTEKGQLFFDECKAGFVFEMRDFNEAANPTQGSLLHPSVPHTDRAKFENLYKKYGFYKAVKGTSIVKQIRYNKINKIKSKVKKMIKKY